MVLKYLLEKEFKQLFRNKFIPKLVFGMPVLFMLLFPYATSMDVKNMDLVVIDNDKSVTSNNLVEKIASTDYFNIAAICAGNDQAMEMVEYGKCDAILEIPPSFEKDIISMGMASVMISVDAVDASKAGVGSSYLGNIVSIFADELSGEKEGIVSDYSPSQSRLGGIKVVPYFRYNPKMDYKIFMIPALIVLILTMICGFLTALNIVGEKEFGTIEQINVTPVRKSVFILGKLIPYWIIGTLMLFLSIFFGWLIYGVWPAGSLFAIFLISMLYIFIISSFGLLISNFSNNMQQAMFVAFFFIIVLFLMSGIFTPIDSMPPFAKVIANCNPVTYFARIMRAIYLKGSTLYDLLPDIYTLFVFLVLLASAAVVSYSKRS
jgi:ABC-2 type transport system permease protein